MAISNFIEPFILTNIVTELEAEHLIAVAEPKLQESTIANNVVEKAIRQSQTAWLSRHDDQIISTIVRRIAKIVNSPIENSEPIQVSRYEPGGFFSEHHDSCCQNDYICKEFEARGGPRIKTILIYLNNDFTEGGTYFPILKKIFKPPKLGALVFSPIDENSKKCHPLALHSGLPVKNGVKYVANVWFREHQYLEKLDLGFPSNLDENVQTKTNGIAGKTIRI
jgi:prolyl 4-hydroxylase